MGEKQILIESEERELLGKLTKEPLIDMLIAYERKLRASDKEWCVDARVLLNELELATARYFRGGK